MWNRPWGLLFLFTSTATVTSGCFTAGYLAQAARGELEILHSARSIPKVVVDPAVPERVRSLLSSVSAIKAYGKAHGLKPTRNYSRYSNLSRPAAVWVVQACAPLAFEVRHWRFPLVGSTPYLGFFDPEEAKAYAASLSQAEGLDVAVRGASAYSTLNWFEDPVLSTMIPPGDEAQGDLANTLLHESVHATFYLKDQSAFDESLASFVADRLTLSWLNDTFGAQSPSTRIWIEDQARERVYLERLNKAYVDLDTLYRSDVDDDEKRSGKDRILSAVRQELGLVRPINNATLSGHRTYQTGTAAFERFLASCNGSWRRFWAKIGSLKETDFSQAQEANLDVVLDRLTASGCALGRAGSERATGSRGRSRSVFE